MSSSDEAEVPVKRRRGVEKENLTPSPENQVPRQSSQSRRKRGGTSSQPSSSQISKKARLPGLSQAGLSQPLVNISEYRKLGKLIRVRLVNFMCHQNLVFTFGERVNFISGKNGSGKSAILTALVLGLGGRTSDTNRGYSLAKLLKNGESRGAIEITISNQGALAYEPEKFGSEITLVRTISDKSSSYKLLSDKGKVVSSKKNDLQLILMSFNIQVNNPVSILNQDTARTFLKTATPKELYNLFRKGTLIDEIEAKLSDLKNRKLPMIQGLLKRKRLALDESVDDLLDYRSKLSKYAELMGFQQESSHLQNALSWIYVQELEAKLNTVGQEMSEAERKIQELQQQIDKREGSETHLKERLIELEAQHRLVTVENETVDQLNVELEQKVAYHKGILNRKIKDQKKLQKKIELERQRIQEIQNEIDNSQSRSSEIDAKRTQIYQKRADLKTRCEELKAVISTTEVHKTQLSNTVDNIKNELERSQNFTQNLARSMSQKTEYLKSLKSERNVLRVYSEWMPQLVAEIDKAYEHRMFSEKPRGPFGRYIKLKEESWGPALENYFGRSVKSFAVCNGQDCATLKRIFTKLNIPRNELPNIVVTKFQNQVYDFSATEVKHPKYRNMMRSIEISDPVVSNILLDSFEPDTLLLVPTDAETYPLVEDRNRVPTNCRLVLNKDGTRFYPSPNYKCYSGNVPDRTRYLQASPEQAIRIVEQEIQTLKQDYVSHKKEMDLGSRKLKEEHFKLSDKLKELDVLRKQLHACEVKLFDAEQEQIPETLDVNVLSEDLQYRQDLIKATEEQVAVLEREKDEALEQCKSFKADYNEKEKTKSELHAKITDIERKITQVREDLRKYSVNHNHFKENLKMEMVKKERLAEKMKHLSNELDEAQKTAMHLCSDRLEPTQPKEEMVSRLNELTRSIRALEKVVGKKPAEPRDYEPRMNKYLDANASYKKVSKGMEELLKNYEALVKRMDVVLEIVCVMTATNFRNILARRNFVGDIAINHEKKTLSLSVKPDANVQASTAITTLSGGERSYSMVAFIMSLWQSMTTPFYFLDEFDVFMDEVNRKLIMDLLMSHARENPTKQFVFLTPHATSDQSTEDVHFFRMEDPRS